MQPHSHHIFARRNTRLLLALVFFVHFALGAGVGLSVDEAHYLLYAVHPALSYFDHPPLVGWVQWPLVALHSGTVLVRLLPGLMWLATVVMLCRLATQLQGSGPAAQRAGFWTAVALSLAPILHLLGIGLLPDTLLMLFTAAVMWQTVHLMQTHAVLRPMPWLVLGVLLGLAGLSKYTAVLLAAAVGVSLLTVHGMRLLRNPWLWMSALVAVALVLPVALWNAQNQWLSFSYQARHGAGSTWQLSHVLNFLLLQLLVYGPLLWWGLSGWLHTERRNTRLLLVFFTLPFAVLAVFSGGGSSLPHWTAPAWVALAPFAGMGLARSMREGWRWLVLGVTLLQTLVCLVLLGLMFTAGQTLLPASWGLGTQVSGPGPGVGMQANPFADLHGWEAAGQRARALAQQAHLNSVAVQNWTLASRLGWHARPLPVHVLEDRFDQFDLWAGDLPAGGSTLLVDWSQMAYTVPIGPHGFAGCSLLDTQKVTRFGAHIASFRFYACQGWSGKPQPQLATVLTSQPSAPMPAPPLLPMQLPLPLPAPPLLP